LFDWLKRRDRKEPAAVRDAAFATKTYLIVFVTRSEGLSHRDVLAIQTEMSGLGAVDEKLLNPDGILYFFPLQDGLRSSIVDALERFSNSSATDGDPIKYAVVQGDLSVEVDDAGNAIGVPRGIAINEAILEVARKGRVAT